MGKSLWVSLACVAGLGCAGDGGGDKTTPPSDQADTDTDTDADTDADADSDTDADTETSFGSMSGQILYDVELDGVSQCHAVIDLVGTPYTGECPNCRFAFEVESTISENVGACLLNPRRTWTEDVFTRQPRLAFSDTWTQVAQYGPPVYQVLHDVLWLGVSLDFSAYGGTVYPGPYWYITTHSQVDQIPVGYYYGYLWNSGGTPATFDGSSLEWDPVWSYPYTYQYTDAIDWSCGYNAYAPYGVGPFTGTVIAEDLAVTYPQQFDAFEIQANAGDVIDISVDTVDATNGFTPQLLVTDDQGCVYASVYSTFLCTFADPNTWYGGATYCPAISWTAPTTGTFRLIVQGYSSYSTYGYVTDGHYGIVVNTPSGAAPTLAFDDEPLQEGPLLYEETESMLLLLGP